MLEDTNSLDGAQMFSNIMMQAADFIGEVLELFQMALKK